VGTEILSAETCILACNARLSLSTNILFYHLNAFAVLSGSTCSKSSAKHRLHRADDEQCHAETAFNDIQVASRGLT
jgi:hypothetical protein